MPGRFRKPVGHLCCRNWIGVTRLGEDADASILSNGARCPTRINVARHPVGYQTMMYVTAIEQCDQYIDIQQRTHQGLNPFRFTQAINRIVGDNSLARRERAKPRDRSSPQACIWRGGRVFSLASQHPPQQQGDHLASG